MADGLSGTAQTIQTTRQPTIPTSQTSATVFRPHRPHVRAGACFSWKGEGQRLKRTLSRRKNRVPHDINLDYAQLRSSGPINFIANALNLLSRLNAVGTSLNTNRIRHNRLKLTALVGEIRTKNEELKETLGTLEARIELNTSKLHIQLDAANDCLRLWWPRQTQRRETRHCICPRPGIR